MGDRRQLSKQPLRIAMAIADRILSKIDRLYSGHAKKA
jgi:hypothetical protein